jgi:hypothetical protein
MGIENVVRRAYLQKMGEAFIDVSSIRSERRVMEKNAQQVRDLCTRIIAERDSQKFLKLVTELNAVLGEREEKLQRSETADG